GLWWGSGAEMLPEVLTAAQVADWLKLSADYVREIAASGHLPCVRFGREYRFQRTQIEAWLTESAYKRASISTAAPTRRRGGRTYSPPAGALDAALERKTKTKRSASPAASSLTLDRKRTRMNSSQVKISYAVYCLKI